jgi:membrane AbrB-like protein
MGAGLLMALVERVPKVPRWSFSLAQGFIGALVARSLSADSWAALGASWPYVLGGTAWGLVAGVLASLALLRLRILPGPSAFWCLSPGGAGVMVIMSGNYGADMRLVAFAQYYRVLMVSLMAVTVSAFFLSAPAGSQAQPPLNFFPAFDPAALAGTAAAVLLGCGLALLLPIPGGLLLLPMAMAVILKAVLHFQVTLPPWLLHPCYALIGWRIGLTFTKSILVSILRMMPALTAAILMMIAGCALYSLALWKGLGLTPLTAYLASCPGGLDAVTIIASSSGSAADLPFIMAMQAMRLLVVITSGPWLYSWLTSRCGFCQSAKNCAESPTSPPESPAGPPQAPSGPTAGGAPGPPEPPPAGR